MSFTVTESARIRGLNGTVVVGKYVNTGGSTGGDITHGLSIVHAVMLQPWGSSILANQPVVNETMPMTSAVTVVTTANESGSYIVVGQGA